MLTDQIFYPKPVIAVGPEFFNADSAGVPDYGFCLQFRMEDRLHELWDFHYTTVISAGNHDFWERLISWGVPIALGTLWPQTPTRTDFRCVMRAYNAFDLFHGLALSQAYRLTGRKNISACSGEVVFEALRAASVNPDPGTFYRVLDQLSLP